MVRPCSAEACDSGTRGRACVQSILSALGEDPYREGLLDTPRRVVDAWRDVTSNVAKPLDNLVKKAVFRLDEVREAHPGVVALRDLPFASVSAETLLPFYGKCDVAYRIADGNILGLSKVARVVHSVSRKIQTQQQLTDSVAELIGDMARTEEIAVYSTATHIFFDQPLCFRQTAFISKTLQSQKHVMQEMDLLLPGHGVRHREDSAERNRLSKMYVDQEILQCIESHALCLFRSLNLDVDIVAHDALKEYSLQLYWATAGLRDSPVPTSIDSPNPYDGDEASNGEQKSLCVSCILNFVSLCEHHLLPFHGRIFVGCSSNAVTSDSSDLARAVKPFLLKTSHQPQVQERLTNQVADYVKTELSVPSVMVLCEAVHLCMIGRGPEVHETLTRTFSKRGDVTGDFLGEAHNALKMNDHRRRL